MFPDNFIEYNAGGSLSSPFEAKLSGNSPEVTECSHEKRDSATE